VILTMTTALVRIDLMEVVNGLIVSESVNAKAETSENAEAF